jgi:hypothetical protein
VTRIYLKLGVYNYDASPRHEIMKHFVNTVEEAQRLKNRLYLLWSYDAGKNRTGKWLERQIGIYGFVEDIIGIFEETTKEVK